jgi:hypothetical protein
MTIVNYKDIPNMSKQQQRELLLFLNQKISRLIDTSGIGPTDRHMAELYILEANKHLLVMDFFAGAEAFLSAIIHLNINIVERHCGIDYHGKYN